MHKKVMIMDEHLVMMKLCNQFLKYGLSQTVHMHSSVAYLLVTLIIITDSTTITAAKL